jgi:hypothetical protein
LAKEAKRETAAPRSGAVLRRTGGAIVTLSCVLLLWVAFYAFGQFLKALPPELHEGTVWKKLESPN